MRIDPQPKRPRVAKKWWVLIGLLAGLVLLAGAGWVWYSMQLTPVSREVSPSQKVVIEQETSFSYVVDRLEARGLIRSRFAALVYGVLSGVRTQLKRGKL